jgi:uncharacterized membrane protein YbhN (UPF0104 family)
MRDVAVEPAAALDRALGGLAGAVAGAAPGWLVLGVVLHLANQVARGRGWYAILLAASPHDPSLRRRDAIAAWMAGAGIGGLASARGGDAARILLVRLRLRRAGCPLLAGTLVAEGAGEMALGAVLIAAAVGLGIGLQLPSPEAAAVSVLVAGAVALGAALAVRRFQRAGRVAAALGQGCASLRAPRVYARRVLPWQLASRACRAGAVACFLLAFGLHASVAAVLLVGVAQGSGRLVPLAPASVGAGVATLAATFEPVTGTAVPAADLAAFFVGMSTVLTVVGAAVAVAICARTIGWRGLPKVLRGARLAPARPALAPRLPEPAPALSVAQDRRTSG